MFSYQVVNFVHGFISIFHWTTIWFVHLMSFADSLQFLHVCFWLCDYWVICLILFLQPRILHFLSEDELFLALVVMNTSLSHGCIKELKAFMEFSLALVLNIDYWTQLGFQLYCIFQSTFSVLFHASSALEQKKISLLLPEFALHLLFFSNISV